MRNYVFSILVLAGLTGCVTRMGTFSMLATSKVDWARSAEFKHVERKVEGKDIAEIYVIVPTKMHVSVEAAVAEALAQVPGAVALENGDLYSKYFWIPLIYGQSGYMVQGTVLVDPALLPADAKPDTP
jgi:hypothetical protein